MEGRYPPPPASHPFPDNPDMTKFWGTPYYKAFFKSAAVVMAIVGTYVTISYQLNKDRTHFMGVRFAFTKEEIQKRLQIQEFSAKLATMSLPVEVRHRAIFPERNGADLRFDDGVTFSCTVDGEGKRDPAM